MLINCFNFNYDLQLKKIIKIQKFVPLIYSELYNTEIAVVLRVSGDTKAISLLLLIDPVSSNSKMQSYYFSL